ncbi:MAG: DUF190 domain-containing protein [Mesosutterella sp.]|nr:DUF190 domain-containing protein [Mesosutterella sp.]
MNRGFQISFFTEQSRRKDGRPMGSWILETARSMGIPGGSLFSAAEGYGRDGWLRSASFFGSGQTCVEVRFALSEKDAERLFSRLREEGVDVFFVRIPIEFGMTGEP